MRVLANDHAGLMNDVYRGQRHIYDLTRKYYLLGRDRLIDELDVPDGGTVLEIGCGTGRNLARIGKRYPDARLYGLDISEEMLKSAAANLRAARSIQRTELAQADASKFDSLSHFGRSRFDRIMFSYTLSMIPDWEGALRQAAALLSSQGSIHIVDFGEQEQLPTWFRHTLRSWLGKFHVEPRATMSLVLNDIAKEHKRRVSEVKLFRDYSRIMRVS